VNGGEQLVNILRDAFDLSPTKGQPDVGVFRGVALQPAVQDGRLGGAVGFQWCR